MKNNTLILILTLFLASYGHVHGQTKVNVPIETEDAFTILAWAFDENINEWRWCNVYELGIEERLGWMYEKRLKVEVDRYDTYELLFIRGFEDCRDTTRVTIYGSFDKEIIEDKKEFRKKVYVNGQHQYFGTKIKRP